jgi:hypothetical protein
MLSRLKKKEKASERPIRTAACLLVGGAFLSRDHYFGCDALFSCRRLYFTTILVFMYMFFKFFFK